jgi:hypothetical protein
MGGGLTSKMHARVNTNGLPVLLALSGESRDNLRALGGDRGIAA